MAPPAGDILLFVNPTSGRGAGAALAGPLAQRLWQEGYALRVFTEHPQTLPPEALTCPAPSPAPAQADRAGEVARAARAAIVIGGDGTLRAVAKRLLEIHSGNLPPLLPVPMGTANLMGRHLGLDAGRADFEQSLLATLARGRIVSLDAARANGQLMLLVAGAGLDGQIIHELHRLRSGPIHLASYALPALLALRQYDYPPITVSADGRTAFRDRPALAFVGNIPEYGTGFPLLPHARPDDGLLDLCILPCASRGQALLLFLAAAAGEHLAAEGAVYLKAKQVRVESPAAVPVQVDGEAAGFTPLEIDLLPQRLPFLIPPIDNRRCKTSTGEYGWI